MGFFQKPMHDILVLHEGDTAKPLALNRHAAAKALGISVVTLDRLVAAGRLRPSRFCRRPLFSLRELERFLQSTADVAE